MYLSTYVHTKRGITCSAPQRIHMYTHRVTTYVHTYTHTYVFSQCHNGARKWSGSYTGVVSVSSPDAAAPFVISEILCTYICGQGWWL